MFVTVNNYIIMLIYTEPLHECQHPECLKTNQIWYVTLNILIAFIIIITDQML